MRAAAALLVLVGLMGQPALAAGPDPLESVLWETVRAVLLGDAPVVFDPERVRVASPPSVENNMNVPVAVRVEGLGEVRRILLFVDHNPVPLALAFEPLSAAPYFEARIKIQEASPIRAAALTGDGVWHVGGVRVDAAGGGCTAPSVAQSTGNWAEVNHVRGQAWVRPGGATRLKIRVVHPMDTGLVANIPAFFIESLTVATPEGRELARFALFEPVAENPVLSLEPRHHHGDFVVSGRDNNGNEIAARIPAAEKALR